MDNYTGKLKSDKSPFLSVMDKYVRLQSERNRTDVHYRDVRLSVNLLDRFIQGESFNQLVVTLYPGNEGYTLALKIQNALEKQTVRIPYEEDELLKCLDNQQLPPVLVELLEEAGAQVFYDGCVFVEVKDYRESTKHSWNVLLKPTPQSILADAQQICNEQGWGPEELLQLESILCKTMAEPLCLSPNPILGELAVNHDSASKQMQSSVFRQSRRTWCESRKRKQSESCSSNEFKLHDFLKKKSLLGRGIPPILQAKEEKECGTSSVQLDVSDVLRLAKPLERPKETGDCSMIPFEEYLYETDRINGRVYLVRLTVLQRPATEEFLGQLYVDRDYKDGKMIGGASCMFPLGSRLHVTRYIQQFTEIFTEEGRKSVKITHQIQGHPPRIMYTQSMREKERLKGKEEQAAAEASATKEPETNVPITNTPPVSSESQASGTLTKTALIESLKSGQVTPAIATLVSNLLSSAQQQQSSRQQPSSVAMNSAALLNGQHQQSLLKNSTVLVRPSVTPTVQNIQLNMQPSSLQQLQQPQLRPNMRPTSLAALLTNKTGIPVNTAAHPLTKGKGLTTTMGQQDGSSAVSSSSITAASPLVGQMLRAGNQTVVSSSPVLPSYSQAISQTTATVVRAIRPAGQQPNPAQISGAAARRSVDGVTLNGSGTAQRFSLTVPALSALLAGTPSADSPVNNNAASNQSLPSLLERLQQSSPTKLPQATNYLNNNNNSMKPVQVNGNSGFNVQSINLAGLQAVTSTGSNLQSIQVSIPGLSAPLSLSLAVSSSNMATSTVSTPSVMGNVRLANAANPGQPINIPLSVLQIPTSGGPITVGSVAKGSSTTDAIHLKGANSSNAQSGGAQSSGSIMAQQQLQLALQRQVQLQLQQKVAAKQKNKPPNS